MATPSRTKSGGSGCKPYFDLFCCKIYCSSNQIAERLITTFQLRSHAHTLKHVIECMCTCTRTRLCSAVKIILFMTISNHVIHSSGTNRSKACNQTLRFLCGRVWPRQTTTGSEPFSKHQQTGLATSCN